MSYENDELGVFTVNLAGQRLSKKFVRNAIGEYNSFSMKALDSKVNQNLQGFTDSMENSRFGRSL